MKNFCSVNSAFLYLCSKVMEEGKVSFPRGLEIKELIGEAICIENPRMRLMFNDIRKFSPQFAIGENLWYLSGSNKLDMIKYYGPSYYKFSDDDLTLNGAYGPRICEQIYSVIKLLEKDSDTRQAIITIFNSKDVQIESKDVPCTCTIQFLVRENKVDVIIYMRSNDLILGFPYDVYSFTILQELVAIALGKKLGKYYHVIGSLHIYDKDYQKIVGKNIDIKNYQDFEMPPFSKFAIDELQDIIEIERKLRNGKFVKENIFVDSNWDAYQKILISKKNGNYDRLKSIQWLGGVK